MKALKDSSGLSKYMGPVFFGAIVGIIVCIIGLLGFSALLTAQDIPQKAIYPLAVIAAGLGSFAGGFASARKSKENGLIYGAVCGIFLFIITFLFGFALFKGINPLHVIIRAVVMIVLASVGGIISVNLKSRK